MTQAEAIPQPLPEAPAVRREPFIFTGRAGEYFGIWIVNVLLTILTLGIYSAWAKVRRQRYFYGSTFLAGASFDYHARPRQILIGRIIVLAMLAVYNITLQVLPALGALMAIAFVFIVPWLFMRGLRFSARATSYRNVRFDFAGTYGGAFKAFVLGALVIYVSAGILAPLASQWMWNYSLGKLRYGDRPVVCEPRLEKLYRQWWLPLGVFVGGGILVVLVIIAVVAATSDTLQEVFANIDDSKVPPYLALALIYAAFVPFILLYMLSGLLYRAGTRNVAFSETIVDGRHALVSSMGRWRYAFIAITNLLATIFTAGLARPWAAIRMARFTAAATALDTTGSLDAYFGSIRAEGSAVGSEFMDVEGFDVGF